MKSIQALFILIFGITSQITFGQFTDEINSNRPGKSMMAYAVGKKIIQTETGVTFCFRRSRSFRISSKRIYRRISHSLWRLERRIRGNC